MKFEDWEGLRQACNEFHSKRSRPGGCAICVCGQGGGGSSACTAFRIVEDFIRFADPSNPKWLDQLEVLKRAIS